MNTKKLIISITIFLLIGASFYFVFGQKKDSGRQIKSAFSGGILTADEGDFDFGGVSMAKGKVTHKFEVKNQSAESVKIKKVYTSCMCTIALIVKNSGESFGPYGMPGHGGPTAPADIEIKNGETFSVEAVFDPAAHGPVGVGLAERTIYLETNSENSPTIELKLSALVSR